MNEASTNLAVKPRLQAINKKMNRFKNDQKSVTHDEGIPFNRQSLSKFACLKNFSVDILQQLKLPQSPQRGGYIFIRRIPSTSSDISEEASLHHLQFDSNSRF
jgi:hypothetical protein